MKRGSSWLVKLIAICMISVMMVGIVVESIAVDEQNVVLSITRRPKIDIVLSKARTETDVTGFENNILSALEALDIDSSDVKVTAIQAQNVNIQTAFDWQQDVSSSIGSINITNNGQNVEMKGNQTNAGKNAIWIVPTENQEQKFTFGYNINYGDSFTAAGMLLRVKQEGNTLTGYMLSFNKSGYTYYSGAGSKLRCFMEVHI